MMEPTWKEAKETIKKLIPSHSFHMWIEPIEFLKCNGTTVFLSCPNDFSKKRVQGHYAKLLEAEINRLSGNSCRIVIEVSNKKGNPKKREKDYYQLLLPNLNIRPHGGRFLRKDFTFDQFVVGGNNDFAYSAALSLASQKSPHQNSLLLLSKTGMGKSHLAQAVGHYILSECPSERVYYITAEDFTNEMIQAIRHNSTDKFKDKYRNQCDVLLLEDVHFLSGKERTQTELSLTLDTLFDSGKKIIFSSWDLPIDIPKMIDKLKSYLSCGIISNIEPPNFRTRVRILQRKAVANGYSFPEEVINYLAGELTDNVRQLNSGLIGVATKSSLLGTPIDVDLARSVVKNIVCQKKHITIDAIKKLICKHYRVSIRDLLSQTRKQSIVHPRQIGIYLSRRYTDQPLQAIGKSFNRYHATALHAINTVERKLKENGAMKKQIEYLCQKLEDGKL